MRQKINVFTPIFNDVPSFLVLRDKIKECINTDLYAITFYAIDDSAGADPQIAELEEQLKSFDMNAINDEIKSLETSNIKFTDGRVYFKQGNFVFKLDGNSIQDLLMTSDVIPENERQRYMQLFGGQ